MLRQYVVAPVLVVALVFSTFSSTVSAAVITTQQAMSAEMRTATESDVRATLAREDVRQAMTRMGVDPLDADNRIAALSDAELMQVQGQLDKLPAGGEGALVVVGIVFVILIILELTGVINIFNRV